MSDIADYAGETPPPDWLLNIFWISWNFGRAFEEFYFEGG
jgi:hypothetical protein